MSTTVPEGRGQAAFVPNVDYDIFLSYKHVDGGGDPWIDEFCESLRLELLKWLGQVSVFRDSADRALLPGDVWRQRLMQAVETAPVFLAVLTDPYFRSDECMEELGAFLGRLKGADKAAALRLVPVLRLPVDNAMLERDLKAFQQQRFFEPPAPGQPPRELRPEDARSRQGRFYEAVVALADALRLALREARGEKVGRMTPLYLGTVGALDDPEHDNLARDLRSDGWLPLPENPYLWSSEYLRNDIAEQITKARLCLFVVPALLDEKTAKRLEVQLELAIEARRRGAQPAPLVWMPAGVSGGAELLRRIREEFAAEIELFDGCGFEDFKSDVKEALKPLRPAATPTPGGMVAVLLAEADAEAAAPLLGALVDDLQRDPKLCLLKPDTALSKFTADFAACEGCVVVWGAADADAVQQWVDSPALAALRERDALALWPAPPLDALKRSLRKRKIVRLPEGELGPALRDFLAAAKAAR
jgi:hypothetical protein